MNELDKLYIELGKAYYAGQYEENLPQLLRIIDEINKTYNDIEEYKKHLCPKCHQPIVDEMIYCASCGYKLK